MENSYLWMGDNPPNPLTGGNPQTPVGQMGKECLCLINWFNIDSSYYGGGIIERQTLEALERAYLSLQDIVTNLYAEADEAVASENYNDASLLQSQADKIYETMENLGIVIAEQEG